MKNLANILSLCKTVSFTLLFGFTTQFRAQNNASTNFNNIPCNGTDCAAFGVNALLSITSGGINNSALGHSAVYSMTNGDRNTGMGKFSVYSANGDDNTGVGYRALYSGGAAADENSAVGVDALLGTTSGNANSAMGYMSLSTNQTGNNNTAIGSYADVSSQGDDEQTAIGSGAIVGVGSNRIRFGDANITLFECMVPLTVLSDGRFKTNIQENQNGIDFIMKLKPVVYNFDAHKYTEFMTQHLSSQQRDWHMARSFEKATSIRRSGFIAQDVDEAAKSCGYDFDGLKRPINDRDLYALNYSQFVVPMVKAIQQQQTLLKEVNDRSAAIAKLAHEYKLNSEDITDTENNKVLSGFVLGDNKPNPFSDETSIEYFIPQKISQASLQISNLAGEIVYSVKLDEFEKLATVKINGKTLKAGLYIYSIVADGILLGSKRMLVSQ